MLSRSVATHINVLLAGLLALASLSGCSSPGGPASGAPPVPETEPIPEAEPAPAFPGEDLTWTESVPSPTALYESQGLAADGRLYVFGGYHNKQIQASAKSSAFDPATSRWFSLAPMPEGYARGAGALRR